MDGFTYDVFLSFRGTDTRHGFTGNLWKALDDRGIRTFFDKEDIPTGKEITPSLLQAIKQSRMAIVVLSRNYATSSFCLNELAHILDCIKGKGRLVWPVFYDVDPSDVRWLKRTYGEAMDMHEASSKYNTDRMQKLKNALHQVANLSGTHFKNGDKYQYEVIEKIVKEASREIKPFTLFVADYPVGLKPQRENIISLLNVGSDEEVHMVGIHGIGGIGKTTLALEVYNSIADQFEGSCFLEKVRENSEKHGLTYLQKILLSKTVGEKEIELTSVNEGFTVIQQRLRQKKVLLLLDDVDNMEQLNAIVGKPEWLGRESRVIITTRDTGLLKSHGVKSTYEVKELNKEDALKLLRWKAFKSDSTVNSSCVDVLNLLERARTISSSLPLALEVIGSRLFKIGIEEWEYELNQYEKIPDKTIQKVLEVSFNALEREERSVFLDIACFFKGHKLVVVEKILHAQHGDSAKGLIKVLVEKSLVKISESGNVALHDLIEDMGKEIVRRESPEEPGKRSRLWNPKDIVQVLEENMGTSEIEVIYLDSKIEVNWDGEAFKKTKNLRTLIITELVELTIEDGGWLFPKQDEGEEKVSPMQSSQVELLHLRNCNLSDESLAIGLKWFANVKELDLSGSKFTTLPECIEKCRFLWKLILKDCEELREIKGIPPNIKTLSALNCKHLTLSCKNKLLNQELHEAGNTWFCLPGAEIPEWFEHQCMQGKSFSFWFRNKCPAIALCVVSLFTWGNSEFPVRVIINGSTSIYVEGKNSVKLTKTYHLHLFDMQMETLDDNMDEALLKNKWNHVEIDFGFSLQNSGIHVLKEKSSMEDIRFTHPENDVNILGLLFETQL